MSTWFKVHDNFFRNPKVLIAGEDAALLYLQGLAYCSDSLTDGLIPSAALGTLTQRRGAKGLAQKLVDAGLWIETESGWEVHDYCSEQQTRAQVEAKREAARERQRRSRSVTAPSRRDSRVSHAEVTTREVEADTDTDTPPPTPAPLLLEGPIDTHISPEQIELNRQHRQALRSEHPFLTNGAAAS